MREILKRIFRFTQRHWILSFIALCIGGFVGANLYATHSGYCFKTGKYFSELNQQELVDSYIPYLALRKDYYELYGDDHRVYFLPYKNIAHFKKVNPDCCKIISYNTTDPQEKYMLRKIPPRSDDILLGKAYRAASFRFLDFIHRRDIPDKIIILKNRPAEPKPNAEQPRYAQTEFFPVEKDLYQSFTGKSMPQEDSEQLLARENLFIYNIDRCGEKYDVDRIGND